MSADSLGELLRSSCTRFADRTAIFVPASEGYQSITYAELFARVRRWASGVRSLGIKRGDRLCIIAENSLEWALLDWACQTLGIVAVPIYPTLPADQAAYIVGDCGAVVVVAGDKSQAAKFSNLGSSVRVLLLKQEEGSVEKVASEAALIDEGDWNHEIEATDSEDIATIIYTSGTTGNPKGAMLPHRNFVWMNAAIRENIPIDENDVFLSFLPLSHVYERANGHFLPISLGAAIAYSRSLASLATDITRARPTIMLCVPRFLEATRERILDGLRKQSPIRRRLFRLAFEQGRARLNGRVAPLFPLTNRLVGEKVRERFGGRFRFFVSGGAAMPRHVYDFYGAFGIMVLQGYGLTETTSGIAVNNPARPIRPETVGELLHGMEGQIAEDGEILLRGPAIMKAYYNLPAETEAAVDKEGWFHTGDIGRFDGTYLQITDRKKDLIVLGNGKNVAPQPIENQLRASALIEEAVVIGDGLDSCVALIVPNFAYFRQKLETEQTDAELVDRPEVVQAIKGEVAAVNKHLALFERVKRHALIPTRFTIDGGELTPTLKVKRRVIAARYADVISALVGTSDDKD